MKKRDSKTQVARAPAAGSIHDQPTQILRRETKPVDDATVRENQVSAWAPGNHDFIATSAGVPDAARLFKDVKQIWPWAPVPAGETAQKVIGYPLNALGNAGVGVWNLAAAVPNAGSNLVGGGADIFVHYRLLTRTDIEAIQLRLVAAGPGELALVDAAASQGLGQLARAIESSGPFSTGVGSTLANPVTSGGETGFLGQTGYELQNLQTVRNTTTEIGDLSYSGHALDQMQNRGITPSIVENAIQTGVPFPGNTPTTLGYFDTVVTVIRGAP